MVSSSVLKDEGMRILAEQLGLVEAERFIALMRREPFDYTQWRHGLYKDVPLDTFLRDAQKYREDELTKPIHAFTDTHPPSVPMISETPSQE